MPAVVEKSVNEPFTVMIWRSVPVIAISSTPTPTEVLVPATESLILTCVPLYELRSNGVTDESVELVGVLVPRTVQFDPLSVEIETVIMISAGVEPPKVLALKFNTSEL